MVRRMRLRTTASLETLRDIATPRRAVGCDDSRYSATKLRVVKRLLRWRSVAKSDRLSSRAARGKLRVATATSGDVSRLMGPPLWNEALAALGATGVQHRASAAGFHARAETVRTRVFEIAGLESAFHDVARNGPSKERK